MLTSCHLQASYAHLRGIVIGACVCEVSQQHVASPVHIVVIRDQRRIILGLVGVEMQAVEVLRIRQVAAVACRVARVGVNSQTSYIFQTLKQGSSIAMST